MPYWRKDYIRETVLKLQKQIDFYEKQLDKEIIDKVINEAKILNKKVNKISEFLVHVFENDANVKALDLALKQLSNYQAIIGFSVNKKMNKVVVVAKVDKVFYIKIKILIIIS